MKTILAFVFVAASVSALPRICTATKLTAGSYDFNSTANWNCLQRGGTSVAAVPTDQDMAVFPAPTTGPVVYYTTADSTLGYTSFGKKGTATKAISGAANNGSGLCRLQFAVSTGFVVGDWIAVQSVGGVPACTGIFQVAASLGTGPYFIDLTGSTFSGTYTSGGTAEPAVALKRTGGTVATKYIQLEIRPGTTLTTHADLLDGWIYNGGEMRSGSNDSAAYFIKMTGDDVSGPATLIFDCTYACGEWPSGNADYSAGIFSTGTATNYNIIRGKPVGGSNTFTGVVGYQPGQTLVASQNWTYTDGFNLGGNSTSDYGVMAYLSYTLTVPYFVMNHVTLTDSGGFALDGAMTGNVYVSFNDVQTIRTKTTYSLEENSGFTADVTTGTRSFANVRFDAAVNAPRSFRGATLTDSYFGDCLAKNAILNAPVWSYASNLFIRCTAQQLNINGSIDGMYYFTDTHTGNFPRVRYQWRRPRWQLFRQELALRNVV
jgi:hypothetical protein